MIHSVFVQVMADIQQKVETSESSRCLCAELFLSVNFSRCQSYSEGDIELGSPIGIADHFESVLRANAHGVWSKCSILGLRLGYLPDVAPHRHQARQPGPLALKFLLSTLHPLSITLVDV